MYVMKEMTNITSEPGKGEIELWVRENYMQKCITLNIGSDTTYIFRIAIFLRKMRGTEKLHHDSCAL